MTSAGVAAQRLGGMIDRPPGCSSTAGRRKSPEPRWAVPALVRRIKPVKAITTTVFSFALVGIIANAVLFQKGHHPAPLFDLLHGAAPTPPVVPPVRGAATTATDAHPTGAVAPAAGPSSSEDPGTPAEAVPSSRKAAVPHRAVNPGSVDAIGNLLRTPGDDGKPGARPKAGAKDPALLRAQRQLKALGYTVKPDGRMDGGTRLAIKRFAHDHHVKADAALTPALERDIADASVAQKAAGKKAGAASSKPE